MFKFSRASLILVATALLVLYFGVTSIGNAIESGKLDRERAGLDAEIVSYQRQYAELLGLRDYLGSDEYVQTIARRELGLVMPGEPALIVVSPDKQATAGRRDRWWQEFIRQ